MHDGNDFTQESFAVSQRDLCVFRVCSLCLWSGEVLHGACLSPDAIFLFERRIPMSDGNNKTRRFASCRNVQKTIRFNQIALATEAYCHRDNEKLKPEKLEGLGRLAGTGGPTNSAHCCPG